MIRPARAHFLARRSNRWANGSAFGDTGFYQAPFIEYLERAWRSVRLQHGWLSNGKIAPSQKVDQKPDEWQSFDIKFWSAQLGPGGKVAKKARITVIHNDKPIIDNTEIDGVTGSAVDNKEGSPAGLMLQGDHTRMWYRNILYRPIKESAK